MNDLHTLFELNCSKQEMVNYILIYLRKSRKDLEFNKNEAMENTLARHEKMLQDYAKNTFGIEIPEKNIFREVVSGDTIADRPQMTKVLELIENDNIKGVLCVEIERLARGNTIDQGVIAQKFQLTNTKILTPQKIFDLNNDFDLSFFEDGLYQSRKFLLYTKKILARGRLQSANEGKCVKSTANWGYKKEKIKGQKGWTLIKDENNENVRKFFDLYIEEDLGTSNLAHRLNILSIPTPSEKSTQWTPAMVRSILNRSEFYAGYESWNKRKTVKKYINGKIVITRPVDNQNCIKVKALHEPTINDDELSIVKIKLKEASKKIVKSDKIKNPLANIVYCGFCGCTMKRRPYNKSYLKSGKIHEDTLICTTPNCPNTSSNLSLVEKKIINILKEEVEICNSYLMNYEQRKKVQHDYDNEIKKLTDEIEKLNSQKSKACDFLEQEIYDENTFINRTQTLNNQINDIKKQITIVENKKQENKTIIYQKKIPIIENILKSYNKADISQKNKFLKSIFEEIKYKKTNKGGRWNKDSMLDFELEYTMKI